MGSLHELKSGLVLKPNVCLTNTLKWAGIFSAAVKKIKPRSSACGHVPRRSGVACVNYSSWKPQTRLSFSQRCFRKLRLDRGRSSCWVFLLIEQMKHIPVKLIEHSKNESNLLISFTEETRMGWVLNMYKYIRQNITAYNSMSLCIQSFKGINMWGENMAFPEPHREERNLLLL